jgi:copper chaperone CopZ
MTRNSIMRGALSLLALAAISIQAYASDAVTYVAGMTGVTWGGCKVHVREAFSKLEGVSKVEIAVGDQPGTQKVTVTSTSGSITKDQAVKSLGEEASRYVVVTWDKK